MTTTILTTFDPNRHRLGLYLSMFPNMFDYTQRCTCSVRPFFGLAILLTAEVAEGRSANRHKTNLCDAMRSQRLVILGN